MKSIKEILGMSLDIILILGINESGGHFHFKSPIDGKILNVIVSWTDGWDHISISRYNKCPTWAEMECVARLLFKDNEYAYQLHVPADKHINCHPYVLHWWRPHDAVVPVPPRWMV